MRAELHKAILRCDIVTTPGARYNLYLNGEYAEQYRFEKDNDKSGLVDVKIEVLSGKIMVPDSGSLAEYPTIGGKSIWFPQDRFVYWFYSKEFQTDVWYDKDINYKHIWPQGPSYYSDWGKPIWEYDRLITPMRNKREENTKKTCELLNLT